MLLVPNRVVSYVKEKPAAAKPFLAVPAPVVSVATTPVFDTKLVNDTFTVE